jgi:hypothetical protein
MKIKIFETNFDNRRAKTLEESINEWLELEKPKVIQVLQTDTRSPKPGGVGISDFYLTITFLYD